MTQKDIENEVERTLAAHQRLFAITKQVSDSVAHGHTTVRANDFNELIAAAQALMDEEHHLVELLQAEIAKRRARKTVAKKAVKKAAKKAVKKVAKKAAKPAAKKAAKKAPKKVPKKVAAKPAAKKAAKRALKTSKPRGRPRKNPA
jgi:type VI protein secretion system component VasK